MPQAHTPLSTIELTGIKHATSGVENPGLAVLICLTSLSASRFGIVVSEKAAAQMISILGAEHCARAFHSAASG